MSKKKETKNILDKIKDYSPAIIGVITFFVLIAFNCLKFVEYIDAIFYFNYYGLDINLYKISDQGFIYNICVSIIFLLALSSLLFCIKQILDNIKIGEQFWKKNWNNLILIIISNVFIVLVLASKLTTIKFLLMFIFITMIEILISLITFKKIKNNVKELPIIELIKLIPFLLIVTIMLLGLNVITNIKLIKNYRITEENKVIVYSNNDYYLTLDCKIEKDKLIIYKGKQNKTNTDNVRSELIKFDKVEIK